MATDITDVVRATWALQVSTLKLLGSKGVISLKEVEDTFNKAAEDLGPFPGAVDVLRRAAAGEKFD